MSWERREWAATLRSAVVDADFFVPSTIANLFIEGSPVVSDGRCRESDADDRCTRAALGVDANFAHRPLRESLSTHFRGKPWILKRSVQHGGR
jgi:hypothetical protein